MRRCQRESIKGEKTETDAIRCGAAKENPSKERRLRQMPSGEALPKIIQEERRVTQMPSAEALPKRIHQRRED